MSGEYSAYQQVDSLERIFEEFPRIYAKLEPEHILSWSHQGHRAMPLQGHMGWNYAHEYGKLGLTPNNQFSEMKSVHLAILKGVLRNETSNLLMHAVHDVTWHDLYPKGTENKTLFQSAASGIPRFEKIDEWQWDQILNPPPNFSLLELPDLKPTTMEFIDPRVGVLFGTLDVHQTPFLEQYQQVLKTRFDALKLRLARLRAIHGSNNRKIYADLCVDLERSLRIDITNVMAFADAFNKTVLTPYKKHWIKGQSASLDDLTDRLRKLNHKSRLENKKMLYLRLAPMIKEIHRYYTVDMVHGYMRTMRQSSDFLDQLDMATSMSELEFDGYVTGLRDTTQAQLKRAIKALVRAFVTMEQIYGEAGFPLPDVGIKQHLKELSVTPFDLALGLTATPATPQISVTMPTWSTSDTFVPHNS